MLPTWILRFIKSYNRNYTLQRYTWSGNDKHKFDGTEPDPSIAEVYASAKAGYALLFERFLKIRVIYSIWKIGYLELILSGDEDKIEEAKPYTIYIIGTGFLIFSQYLIRYSIILADKYYRTENGQNMNEYEVIDS